MARVVVQIQRGRTAGKWRARYEEYGRFTLIGIADTEKEAWALFDQFEDDMPGAETESISAAQSNKSPVKHRKLSIEEWNRISRQQIKELSAKYK